MKLVIVAPHFPPSALPPAQRVRLMLPHLRSQGVSPVIFTTLSKYREEAEDPWMVELAGKDYELIEIKSLSQKWTRKMGIGDLGLRMIPFLFHALWKYCRKEKVDFILYPVPPWYILMIAPILKKLTKVPYGIDFIDPWVSGSEKLSPSLKSRLSQSIARTMEFWVGRNSSLIFSVSEGINQDLLKRHPSLCIIPMKAIPYGAERRDYELIEVEDLNLTKPLIRYVGAVWPDAYPVLDILLRAFSGQKNDFSLEFYGTSYAGGHLVRKQLDQWIAKYKMGDNVVEFPNRVPYKEAVGLNLEADLLLLFGGMKAYYAASKLFGLIVSGKPFLAFLHRDSFPAKFLKELNYPYLFEYSDREGDLPINHLQDLSSGIAYCLEDIPNFTPLDLTDIRIQEHTAFGMTKAFVEPIKELVDEGL